MLYSEKAPQGSYAECLRTIRTNIKYSSVDKDMKTLLVTSCDKSEGKSTIVANLAVNLAQDNNKVLVIDCDLRRPTIHKKFQTTNQYGLTDLLIDEKRSEEVIYKYNENLDVIPSGSIPPNPAELLSTKKLETLLNEYKKKYDYVLLDTTPLGVVADSQILSFKTDGVILVARAEKTKKKKLLECKKLIDKVDGNIIGVILNRAKLTRDKYYYYY